MQSSLHISGTVPLWLLKGWHKPFPRGGDWITHGVIKRYRK
jgi:hypothetical protein